MPLTDTAIRSAKAGAKTKKMFDAGGLYLEVAPSGGKWWRLKFRYGGKEKRLSLGVYAEVSLKEARERRDEARKLRANDIDPSEHRNAKKAAKEERAANSFEVVAREWLFKCTPNWSANHGDRIVRRLERDIFPWIGGKPIADMTLGKNQRNPGGGTYVGTVKLVKAKCLAASSSSNPPGGSNTSDSSNESSGSLSFPCVSKTPGGPAPELPIPYPCLPQKK